MRIDLHLHTNASDGTLSTSALIASAASGRLDVIAITDHDTARGCVGIPAPIAGRPSPIVIPGIEVSSTHGGEDLHFLGYFIDPLHPALVEYGEVAARRRVDRIRGMIDRLDRLGVHVTFEEVIVAAGPGVASMGRPHLARALMQRGHVQTFSEAFDRFLADGGPAFLPTELLTPREAIDLIHAAGGISVWAHPPMAVLERELEHFARWGLQGLECLRPRNTATDVKRLRAEAATHGLVVSGGSDWHGGWHGRLGDFAVSRGEVEELLLLGGL